MALYRRARSTRLLVVTLVLLSLLTITLDFRGGTSGPFEAAGRGTLAVVATLQRGVRVVLDPVASFFSGLARVGAIEQENARLRDQLAQARRDAERTVATQRELERLQQLLGLKVELRLDGVAATIVGQSIGNFEWWVTIDRGSSDGIRVNMPVVSGEGLVGHVTEVAAGSSKILLIVDPESRVAARLSASGETGLVVGQTHRNDLSMDLVNDEATFSPNEVVETSGYQVGRFESIYPPGIPIGFVSHAYSQPGSLTPLIAVRPAVDFTSLEFVLVVTGGP